MTDSKQFILANYHNLQKEYDASVRCNRCGFCETVCPTYMVTGKEIHSPRGRNQAFRQILEGKILHPEMASEIFSTCLTCHACTSVCFSQVPVGKLMAHAKALAESPKFPKWALYLREKVMRFFLQYRSFLTLLIWPLRLMKKLGISGFLNSVGLLKVISPAIARAEAICPKTPLFVKAKSPKKTGGKEVHYFSGCGIHFLYPQIGHTLFQVLDQFGISLLIKNHPCCGLMLHSAADVEGTRRLARENIRLFSETDSPILVDDDSCCGFMKGYGDLLGGDPSAQQFSKRVKNLPELLCEQNLDLSFSEHSEITVTCHDSCQIGNAYGQIDPVRTVVKSLKGVRYVEMEESTWCCGGAGAYCFKHPRLSEDILDRKIKNIEATKAQVVVAGASSCLMHIQHGIRERGLKIQAVHVAELIGSRVSRLVGVQSGLSKPLP